MNILKIDHVEIDSTGDMLKDIFRLQNALIDKYSVIERSKGIYYPENRIVIDNCEDQEFIKRLAYRCIAEIFEAMECLRNKAWKQSEVVTDTEHLKEEIADALHFFIELCTHLDMSAEDLYKYYFKKNHVNQWRIGSNY